MTEFFQNRFSFQNSRHLKCEKSEPFEFPKFDQLEFQRAHDDEMFSLKYSLKSSLLTLTTSSY